MFNLAVPKQLVSYKTLTLTISMEVTIVYEKSNCVTCVHKLTYQ